MLLRSLKVGRGWAGVVKGARLHFLMSRCFKRIKAIIILYIYI